MKNILLLTLILTLGFSINAQTTIFNYNTITLRDPLTTESFGSVQNKVEIEFDQTNKSVIIYNYFTHGKMVLKIYDTSINEEIKLFFGYDAEGNNVKLFVSEETIILTSKAIPYTTIYSNE